VKIVVVLSSLVRSQLS